MRLTLRAKLFAVVLVAGVALGSVTLVSVLLTARVQDAVERVRAVYLPLVELGPTLDHDFERLSRAFQDAVAAGDVAALDGTGALLEALLADLAAAEDAVESDKAEAATRALRRYHAAALDVSGRLIAGETGEALVDAIAAMQGQRERAVLALDEASALDREALAGAFAEVAAAQATSRQAHLVVGIGCLVLAIILTLLLARGVLRSLASLDAGLARVAEGDFSVSLAVSGDDELARVAARANEMAQSLARNAEVLRRTAWLEAGQAALARELRGAMTPTDVARQALAFYATHLSVPVGALYQIDARGALRLQAQHAPPAAAGSAAPPAVFQPGEGLVGQAAQRDELTVIPAPPAEYLQVRSALGQSTPAYLVLVPLPVSGKVIGVVELALFGPFDELAQKLVLVTREAIAVALEVARAHGETRALLAESQAQERRLAAQDEELRAINDELQTQQEELRQTNEELSQQTAELEARERALAERNIELDLSRQQLERKNEELATVSAYKSRFLTSMSHELRTPLNSMLLLSGLLADNDAGNLTDKQVEYSRTIHAAGKDLLGLINQVLDLAKVEAGKQEIHLAPVHLGELARRLEQVFEPLAAENGLALRVSLDPGLPAHIYSDGARVHQILVNLLGNAVKFSSAGTVALEIGRPAAGTKLARAELRKKSAVAFAVRDEGPGIAPEDRERIFAPFEQLGDGGARGHRGTGLGLGLARELAALLGGEIHLDSAVGAGSTFTLYLPERTAPADRSRRTGGGAADQAAAGVAARAKHGTRILVVEDDRVAGESLVKTLAAEGFEARRVASGAAALEALREGDVGCVILDLTLPDMDGLRLLELMHAEGPAATPSIVVYTARSLDAGETMRLEAYSEAIVLKDGPSTERVLNEVRLFMRRLKAGIAPRRAPVRELPPGDLGLAGKTALVVDDDMRTVYALSATLRAKGMEVHIAENGQAALEALQLRPGIDLVLMDIMMPEMDGLEAMKRIRADERFRALPIIALTAKAMKGDADRCIAAGADAYLAKPIDATRLLGLISERLAHRGVSDGA